MDVPHSTIAGIPHDPVDVAQNRDLAAFSYCWIGSVVIYWLAGRHSAFVRFHAKQSMVLTILTIVFWFVPVIGTVLEFILLVGMASGFLSAAQGLWSEVPIIGPVSHGEKTIGQAGKQIAGSAQAVVLVTKQLIGRWKTASPPPPAAKPETIIDQALGHDGKSL